jgi:DNA (cytosine-5)-methyltransferase 1
MSSFGKQIEVVDLFSGPGGLGEGFSSLNEGKSFKIIISAEMDPSAYMTLRLRTYFRLLRSENIDPTAYYDYCNGHSNNPWNGELTLDAWEEAGREALNITLGTDDGDSELFSAINDRMKSGNDCVLIGGPPCQAYSIAGRSRNRGNPEYRAEDDKRHFLYREYLRVISRIRPAVFVMENVKGIISSTVAGRRIFHEILNDLATPTSNSDTNNKNDLSYRIYSLSTDTSYSGDMEVSEITPSDFVICAENHGIPQARHRVILLGVRSDIESMPCKLERSIENTTLWDAIGDLPKIRSRISGREDSTTHWVEVISDYLNEMSLSAEKSGQAELKTHIKEVSNQISCLPIGANRFLRETIPNKSTLNNFVSGMLDPKLEVILNHESRSHMREDLKRYAFASCFAGVKGRSPKGHQEFNLPGLSPNHANWETGHFADRFRVQLRDSPSTTITSHISKDGHYYIHPDPQQCRSLSVREAARLQTFPDNYYFLGNRTQQYHQVGNAVPPALSKMIAKIVLEILVIPKN